MSIANWSLL